MVYSFQYILENRGVLFSIVSIMCSCHFDTSIIGICFGTNDPHAMNII